MFKYEMESVQHNLTVDKILLYDSTCVFCSRSVQFVLKHDHTKRIHFASLNSTISARLAHQYNIQTNGQGSVIYISAQKHYVKSRAVLEVLKDLGGLWPLFYVFIICPPFVRDRLYDWIAKNRHRLTSNKKSCILLNADQKLRFLD